MRSLFLLALMLPACGYSLQNSHNALLKKEGVRKIYVAPLVNKSFVVGMENVVYNDLVKTVAAHRRVELVRNSSDADAILTGVVTDAHFSVTSAPIAHGGLDPYDLSLRLLSVPVATEYSASLTCSFSLKRVHTEPGKLALIWSAPMSKSKLFPGATQLGVAGTTSALINDSEFDRALKDVAVEMMEDLHESMLSMF